MAIIRRYGPTKGAGTVVIEQPPEETIEASALGVCAVIGQFERGKVNDVTDPQYNRCPTKSVFEKLMGGRLDATIAPDVCQDFFDHGNGAGELIAVRVTDGTEKTAEVTLFSRHWGTAFTADQADKDNQTQTKVGVLKITADNPGAWAGRARTRRAEVADVADIGTTTLLDADAGWTVNEWAGGQLVLDGVSGKVYDVVSNTATILTVESDADMDTDLGTGSEKGYEVALAFDTLESGDEKGMAVRIKEAQTLPDDNFGLEVFVDGQLVRDYATLSMDTSSQYYVEKVINDDSGNDWIVASDLWDGQGAVVPDVRPANQYGQLRSLTATAATFNVCQVVQVDDSNVQVVNVTNPGVSVWVPHRLTFTYDLANFKYTVAASLLYWPDIAIANLDDFAIPTGEQLEQTWSHPGLGPDVTVDHLADPADATQFVIDVLPIDHYGAVGGEIAPDAGSNPLKRFLVSSADSDSVAISSGDLTTVGTAPVQAAVTGTVAEPYAIVAATNDGFSIKVDGRKIVTDTLTAGATQTAAQVVADINGAFDTQFGAGVINPASVYNDGTDNFVKLESGWYEGGGPASLVEVATASNDCYTDLGLTVAETQGTEGTEAQLLFGALLGGGFDGGVPADQEYLDALSITDSPLNRLVDKGLGVIQISSAGVTSTTVQKQGLSYAEAKNHMYHVLIPEATTDEVDAVDYINGTIGRSDFGLCYFPTYADVPDPDRDGLTKAIPITGQVLGLDAKFARSFEGYHRPAAGIDAVLPRIVELPTGDTILNEELLNPQGLNVVKKKQGNFVVWGGRTISKTSAFKWKTHRLQLSHYEHTFLESFDYVIFQLNNAATRQGLISTFRVFFAAEFAKGAVVGDSLSDAVSIKIDDENNTDATAAAGDLHAEILLKLVNFVERFVIRIGKQGIFEGTT